MPGASADAARLQADQTVQRRMAELVARDRTTAEVFEAIVVEAAALPGIGFAALLRFDDDGFATAVAADGTPQEVAVGDRRPRRSPAAGIEAPVVACVRVEGHVWGVLAGAVSEPDAVLEAELGLAVFAELAGTAIAAAQTREELRELAHEQAALRRIAELSVNGESAEIVLQAVAVQASRLAGVQFGMVLRFETEGSTEIVALDGAPPNFRVGLHAPARGDGAAHRVWRTGRAARIDDLASMTGQWPQMAARYGFTASAGVPILQEEGRMWGAIIVVGRESPMLPAIEAQLTDFAKLVSAAISAAHAHDELRVLASEQAALRRVAELAARGAALDEVFAAVAAEASRLLGDLATALLRFDAGDAATTVAAFNSPAPIGLAIPAGRDSAVGELLRTGRPIRVDSFAGTSLADLAEELGVGAGVAVPIAVEGHVWGALTTSTPGPPLPGGTEERLAQFAELAAAAIATAENRAQLIASRARVIATADETRRRLQRDLHDGSQQRLVHALITLKLAKAAESRGEPVAALIDEALQHAERANSEFRDLVRGILPAALTRGGLRSGIESLVSDLPLPVGLQVTSSRLPAPSETTAYFIVAEALTNVVKHADATEASVQIAVEDDRLSIDVRDDGSGGADPARGTGLIGLLDRVEASAGSLTISSPPRRGTTLHVTLPLEDAAGDRGRR